MFTYVDLLDLLESLSALNSSRVSLPHESRRDGDHTEPVLRSICTPNSSAKYKWALSLQEERVCFPS